MAFLQITDLYDDIVAFTETLDQAVAECEDIIDEVAFCFQIWLSDYKLQKLQVICALATNNLKRQQHLALIFLPCSAKTLFFSAIDQEFTGVAQKIIK